MPRVSVIVPVHNAGPYLRDALESLSRQSFDDLEIVAVDDGSTDASRQILWEHRRREPRLRVLEQPHRGTAQARDAAIAAAQGELLAFHDADDLAMPERIARQVAFLDAHPDLDVVGGALWSISADGHPLREFRPPRGPETVRAHLEFRFHPAIAYVTVMVRRTTWERIGGHRAQFSVGQDQDALIRLLPARMDNVPEVVTLYRRHTRQATQRKQALVVYTAVMAKASHHCRRQGRPDPVDVWDGSLDIDLLAEYGTDPYLLAYLYAGLLTSGATTSTGEEEAPDTGAITASPAQLRDRLAQIPLGRAELAGPVAMLLRAIPSYFRAQQWATGVLFGARVVRHFPGECLRALQALLQQRALRSIRRGHGQLEALGAGTVGTDGRRHPGRMLE